MFVQITEFWKLLLLHWKRIGERKSIEETLWVIYSFYIVIKSRLVSLPQDILRYNLGRGAILRWGFDRFVFNSFYIILRNPSLMWTAAGRDAIKRVSSRSSLDAVHRAVEFCQKSLDFWYFPINKFDLLRAGLALLRYSNGVHRVRPSCMARYSWHSAVEVILDIASLHLDTPAIVTTTINNTSTPAHFDTHKSFRIYKTKWWLSWDLKKNTATVLRLEKSSSPESKANAIL